MSKGVSLGRGQREREVRCSAGAPKGGAEEERRVGRSIGHLMLTHFTLFLEGTPQRLSEDLATAYKP